MPVEPVPCGPGGGTTPVEVVTCCSPSIASTPLCRDDGTTVLLVVRSGCVECGEAAADPVAVGWIDAATGVFTPGVLPADAGPCDAGCLDTVCRQLCDDTDGDGAADTTYSELWCIRADGTADLVLTYQDDPSVPYTPVAPVDCTYGCPESETVTLCDEEGPFLRRYTWLQGTATYEDFALDGITPHVVTGTVGTCDQAAASATCVDTVCRTRCDDTDGDGQADATYSELWCVQGDGTAELVLTYQDDPSAPYTPVAPVDCEYASPASEVLTLCDEVGPFLRRYSWLGDAASFEDVALDGATPYVVTGTVGVCPAAPDCEAPTTPAATLGLCLADGTPIAVVVTRDCAGVVTQDGWINLITGTYSTGAPPAGAAACGDSRAFELAGLLCDIDPASGDVHGLVLVEYAYNPDGSLASVRLVDPATGATYTLQGELRRCPGGTETQPEQDLTVLCDTAADGTTTAFLRDYRRDPASGQINGHTDYALDGSAYAPTGEVGQCGRLAPEPCRTSSALLVCDLPTAGEPTPTVSDTDPTPYQGTGLGAEPLPGGAANLWAGGAISIPADSAAGPGHINQHLRSIAANVQAPRPGCDTGTATVTASIRVQRTGPSSALGGNGLWALWAGSTRVAIVTTPNNTPVGYTGTLTVSGQVPAADLAAGNVRLAAMLETWHTAAHVGGWIVDQAATSVIYDQTGCETQFLRNVTVDCETGEVTAVTDTTLDGAPYTPAGEVGQCTASGGACCPEEPCRNTSSLLLCDLPTDGTPAPTVTDTPGAPYYPYTTGVAIPGAQTLWDGGTLTLPDAAGPQPGTTGTVRTAAAIIQTPRPVCDTGTAHVTVQVDVTQLGPDNGCRATGFLGLYNGTGEANRIALALAPPDTPAGWSGTLTAEADVPADDLAAGNIAVLVAFDAYDDSGTTCPPPRRTGWRLTEFAATVAYDQTGCETQFLRNVTVDCETGEVTAVTDTTLDGDPYTVTGEAGQCIPASGGGTTVQPCGDTEVVQLCDLTYDPQAPIPTPAGDFTLTGNVVAANGGTTLWFAQANQEANGVAELTVGGLLPAVLYEFRFASAWIGAGGADPVNNAAIYRLDILDGATVLATRTRNVSNGSNVFPGGVLSEDLPPLAFIAPATGAVTIRFTDLTTGGPVNDRDLFLMPFEVRTAVLTVTRTPFLRRFTFDCDGGLTSSQDLALDGATPYTVAGEVGQCAGDGDGSSVTVPPCGANTVMEACRCDDADGDGIADTDYVELLGVDCEGALTSLGTYMADLSAPYVPVAPIDCAETGEGAEPAIGVQARRVELAAGETWDAEGWPTLQSVTAIAHGGTGTVTTLDGPSTLHTGEAATWSVARDTDALLTGPLTITADTGTVTLSYTIGVTL
jgi:hypothetical protein